MSNPITWRNINAPDFSDATRGVAAAQQGINQGFDIFNRVLQQRNAVEEANWQQEKVNNTQALMESLYSAKTPEELAMKQAEMGFMKQGMGAQFDGNAVRMAQDGRGEVLQNRALTTQKFEDALQAVADRPAEQEVQAARASANPEAAMAALRVKYPGYFERNGGTAALQALEASRGNTRFLNEQAAAKQQSALYPGQLQLQDAQIDQIRSNMAVNELNAQTNAGRVTADRVASTLASRAKVAEATAKEATAKAEATLKSGPMAYGTVDSPKGFEYIINTLKGAGFEGVELDTALKAATQMRTVPVLGVDGKTQEYPVSAQALAQVFIQNRKELNGAEGNFFGYGKKDPSASGAIAALNELYKTPDFARQMQEGILAQDFMNGKGQSAFNYLGRAEPAAEDPGSTGATGSKAAPANWTVTPGKEVDGIFERLKKQESGGKQFDANGNPLTSPAGALGVAQVMPGTGEEAAKLAGLPWDLNKLKTDPEYNEKLGKAYLQKQLETFGSLDKALAAYNAGPDWVRQAVTAAGKAQPGTQEADWMWQLNNDRRKPSNQRETANYVASIMRGYQPPVDDSLAPGEEVVPTTAQAAAAIKEGTGTPVAAATPESVKIKNLAANDPLMTRLLALEQQEIAAGTRTELSKEAQEFAGRQAKDARSQNVANLKDLGRAVGNGYELIGPYVGDSISLIPRMATKAGIAGINTLIEGVEAAGGPRLPYIKSSKYTEELFPDTNATLKKQNTPAAEDLAAQRAALIKEFKTAGGFVPTEAQKKSPVVESTPATAFNKPAKAFVPSTSTPLLDKTDQVANSTSFSIGGNGVQQNTAPVDFPKGTKFGPAKTVLEAKPSAALRSNGIKAVATFIPDGDTANFNDLKCRIDKINAPEVEDKRKGKPAQDYAKESTRTLQDLIENKEVTVRITKAADTSGPPSSKNNYHRAMCQIEVEGKDVSTEMIRAGAAWLYRRYNNEKALSDLEDAAKKDKLGLWRKENPEDPERFNQRQKRKLPMGL